MSNEKVNLSKVRDEIEARKRERGIVPQRLGEATGNFTKQSDEFLNGLLISLRTGQPTPSTNLLREVENKVAEKTGEPTRARIPLQKQAPVEPEYVAPKYQRPERGANSQIESFDREEKLFTDLEAKRRRTLAESIGDTIGNGQSPKVAQYSQNQPMMLNEAALLDNVKGVVNEYLAESLLPILEDSTRNVIIEMYAAEKLKTVLYENKEMIKSLILEVFRELQAKQKAKQ